MAKQGLVRAGKGGGRPVAGILPRRAALALLAGVLAEGRLLSEMLAGPGSPLNGLSASDRARAQRMATMVLRNLSRADAVLAPLAHKSPSPAIRDLLRLAVVELLAWGEAAHGVVNVGVELAREQGRGGKGDGQAAFVNAVLRRVAETDPDMWKSLPPQPLPGWLRGRLMSAYGKSAVQAMEAVQALPPPIDLTPRDPTETPALAAELGAEILPNGSLRLREAGQISDLPGYAAGRWWVQDFAASLAVPVLNPKPGMRVLDLCAAPGGKTLQLAAARANVTALDLSETRLARLHENLARTGLTAQVVTADALEWKPEAPFDAVLLDAPCSATGTIRRHPDLPFAKRAASLNDLFTLQGRMIDRALGFLKPGGKLVYCTCSLLPEEGERQIASALGRHGNLQLLPEAHALPGIEPAWIGQHGLRLRPDFMASLGGMDGFFIACLLRG